ncbi:MAG TPA: CHASE4 domain-containing protein, partial [Methanocella sp.]
MLLREKTLIVIVAIFAILILIEFVFSNSIVMNSFTSLEQNDTLQKIKQADGALNKELESMDVLLTGRAMRDDSYAYMAHPQASYLEQNLGDESFISQDLNLLLMVDGSGDITYGKAFDLKSRTAIPLPESIRPKIYNGSPLVLSMANGNRSGVVILPEGPLLVVARPILDGKKQGPAHGTMIIGRYIDDGWIGTLSDTTRLNLTMYRLDDENLSADLLAALDASASEGRFVTIPLDDDSIGGYEIIEDVFGKPALILRVEQPRPIYRKGIETIAFIILSTLVTGVVIASLAMVLLSKIVLSRLSSLDMSVRRISASDDLSGRVSVVGKDELSNLSRAINHMLTSLEMSRQKLHESESRYHAVVEDQSELICRFRPEGTIAFTNEACRRYFGMDGQPWPGQNFLQSLPTSARGSVDELLQSLTEKEPAGVLECPFDREGTTQWLQWNFRAIFDRRGLVSEFQAVGRDITELKRNEEQIKASLKEKDALLKEIHHRVKNNLQIISSILSLQEARVTDQASRDVLADSRNRIKSMALIHERLYGSNNLSSIDFSEYIASLLSHLSSSYGVNNGRITVRTDIESLSLNIDIAIPLGLMVNEIVTNSFKHAFPGETPGEISVTLHRVNDGKYRLTVGDNGVGMPADFDIERTTSLGLQLVQALSQQTNSEITI